MRPGQRLRDRLFLSHWPWNSALWRADETDRVCGMDAAIPGWGHSPNETAATLSSPVQFDSATACGIFGEVDYLKGATASHLLSQESAENGLSPSFQRTAKYPSSRFKILIPIRALQFLSGTRFRKNRIETGSFLFVRSGTTASSFGARVWSGRSGVLGQHIFRVLMDQQRMALPLSLLGFARVDAIGKQSHGFKPSFVLVEKSA